MNWDVRYASSQLAEDEPAPVQSVVVGNVVFVSGCTAGKQGELAPRRVEDQVDSALETTRRALEAAGSRMENVVKTFFLLTSLGDYGSVRKTETEFYERHAPQLVATPPAATLMVVPSLARPEFLVQYEVIAALDRDMPGWGGDVLPGVLGRQGARIPARAEGAREVRAEPVDRKSARHLGLPGVRSRDGESRDQRLRGAVPDRARQDQDRRRGDGRVARQSREDECVHQGCERAGDLSRDRAGLFPRACAPRLPPIHRRARCS